MLKGFTQFVNENKSDSTVNIDDLRTLVDLGLIDKRQFNQDLIKISQETGKSIESLLRPSDFFYDIEDDNGYWSNQLIDLFKEWTGPRGEVIVYANGECGEDDFEVTALLSTGGKLYLDYSLSRGEDAWIIVDGVKTTSTVSDFNELAEEYDDDGNWKKFWLSLLDLTVKTSY